MRPSRARLSRRLAPATSLLLGVAALFASGCGVELEHGLDERQANQIAALLESSGIAADKERDEGADGWKIVVPHGEVSRSFHLLAANDLPRRERRGLGDALAERSLLPSLAEEHARLESARGVELELTLEHVPGVLSARVHLALPDSSRFDGIQPAAHAAVLLRTEGNAGVTEAGVRALLAGAVTGLAERDVAVVFASGVSAPALSPLEPVGPLRVARGERGRVVAIAASGLALVVLLGAALLLTALRLAARPRLIADQSPPSKRTG